MVQLPDKKVLVSNAVILTIHKRMEHCLHKLYQLSGGLLSLFQAFDFFNMHKFHKMQESYRLYIHVGNQ